MPGVPPDAIDNLKRALKGLFKRGKKSKTTTPTSTTPTQPPQPSAGGSAAAAAPQLPPIQNASPLQSATDTSKPLPPTHPLAIGPLDKPVETVPPNRDAQPGPPAPVVGPAETADQVQEQQKDSEIPVTLSQPSSAVDGVRSGDGSVVTNGASPQSPPKTDGAVEEFKTGEPAASTSQPAITNNENIPPTIDTSTADDNPTTNGDPAPAPASATTDLPPASPEEKVSVMDEPPPIKAAKPAPGMSATSGPLEDYPEGGDMRDP